MLAVWREFDPRALLIFIFFLAVAETFVQIRWRLNIVCRECGFDPVLYLRDSDKAADKVREQLARRKQDPTALLRTPLHLPPRPSAPSTDLKNDLKASSSPGRQSQAGWLSKNV
jgi:hypothetical protein